MQLIRFCNTEESDNNLRYSEFQIIINETRRTHYNYEIMFIGFF